MMKHICNISHAVLLAVLLSACGGQGATEEDFALRGTWVLETVQDYEGGMHDYSQDDHTLMRIYDDTCYYECRVQMAPSGKMFEPAAMEPYTLIERGPDDYLYLQGENTHPLHVLNDSVITIQETGWKYTWKMNRDYDEETLTNILRVVKEDLRDNEEPFHRYVFSYAERELETFSHKLVYSLAIVLLAGLLILYVAYFQYRNKKRVKLELRQLKQEREAMPEPVREAIISVEEQFHKSDFYLSLRQKIGRGEQLSQKDWDGIEEQFRHVYPRFTSTLLTLHNMSPTELQVCQLLKLNATPSEISAVLCKEKSSVSSIRSRLYGKVFGQKGTGKDWDDFILSL